MSTIGVLARPDLKEAGPTVAALVAWLSGKGARVCLDDATAALGGASLGAGCLVASGRDLAGLVDALVVLGGDGTLLAASRLLEKPIPVLGVNFGSLGFLTEITLDDLYPALEGVLAGRYEHEDRRLLRAVVHRKGRPDVTADVLNDVVITKAGPSRIIEVDVTVDGAFVSSFRADGIIVEVHPNPAEARSDGKQSLTFEHFAQMLARPVELPRTRVEYYYSLSWEVITVGGEIDSYYKAGRWFNQASGLQVFPSKKIAFIYLCNPPAHLADSFMSWRQGLTGGCNYYRASPLRPRVHHIRILSGSGMYCVGLSPSSK